MSKQQVSNWGNYPIVDASKIIVRTDNDVRHALQSTDGLIARGNGGCYGDSSLSTTIVSTLAYDKIVSFDGDHGTITAQSGITFDSILEFVVPRGWFLPVTPGTKFITLGGAIASDIHGKNHHVEGSFKKHITALNVMLASGEIVTCGREVNADLFRATCGGMGLTGIILTATFNLKRIETSFIKQTSVKARNLDEVFSLFEQYQDSTYSVAWIDCLQSGKNLGRSLLLVGEHAKQSEIKKGNPYPVAKGASWVQIPFNFPEWVLNEYTVKIFNFLFYNKQIGRTQQTMVSFDKFFYPLDFLKNWNRMYGNRGFVQYQFVLPMANSNEGLRKILTEISKRGMGSFLAVLKLFGESEGLVSFPMRGYTLALDFPIRKGLFEFLDELDAVVLAYGGRLYLTKDARMKKKIFWDSYPNAGEFKQLIQKFNPGFKCRSIQSDRLGITTT
jgi:decaprenylphospho-beta-D-ribofuranose 2-oxidase